MPYGNLEEQAMRFASYDDLDKYKCTIEEREEFEPISTMAWLSMPASITRRS